MAHQSHNIPWSCLVDGLVQQISGGPNERRVELVARTDEATIERLLHFVRVFTHTVQAFTDTYDRKQGRRGEPSTGHDARRHAPAKHPLPKNRITKTDTAPRLYDESTEAAVCDYLERTNFPYAYDNALAIMREYSTPTPWISDKWFDQTRASIVMSLFALDERMPLLRLARARVPIDDPESHHPHVERRVSLGATSPLHVLWASGGHVDGGVRNVLQAALSAYIALNVFYACPELWGVPTPASQSLADTRPARRRYRCEMPLRDYRHTKAYERMRRMCTESQDGDSYAIRHREFWASACAEDGTGSQSRAGGDGGEGDPLRPDRASLERLKEYLAWCWNQIVLVHWVYSGTGVGIDLHNEVLWVVEYLWGVKLGT